MWDERSGWIQAYNAGAMTKIFLLTAALVMFSAVTFAQTAAPTTPVQDSPRAKAAELLKQGRKLQQDGKLDDALETYKQAMTIAPDFYDVHLAMGSALDVKGDYAEARKHLQRAIDLVDADHKPGVLRSMAVSYAFEKDAKEADKYERQAYELQLHMKPIDAAGTMNELARILLESGKIDYALEGYKIGCDLGLKSASTDAERDLWNFRWEHAQARVAARNNDRAEAAKHVAAAKTILDKNTNPNQAIFFPYLTGYVAFYGGDYRAARSELQKADQKDPFILALLAQTEERLGDKTAAKEYWTKVLGIYSHNPTNAFARPLAKKALGVN